MRFNFNSWHSVGSLKLFPYKCRWNIFKKSPADSLLFCSPDNWIKCDDDKLSIVKDEDILKLSGGGKCEPVCPKQSRLYVLQSG